MVVKANQTRTLVRGHDYQDRELGQIVLRAEKEDRMVERPPTDEVARQLRRVVHSLVAQRLIAGRNKSGLNNDKINQLMHSLYLERKREAKAWTFTNAVSKRIAFLPDEEEVEMLSQILNLSPEHIGLHLKVIPWAMEDQKAEHEERRRKSDAKKDPATKTQGPKTKESTTKSAPPVPAPKLSEKADASSPQETKKIPNSISAGDLKISHQGEQIHVHGKVWCDRRVAQRLRMIVPLKLLEQARGDNPWAYEIKGPVHNYQLYNLMHVLYGAPRVLQVQLDE